MTEPNFLIIGALRSGTTALARYLGAHPRVFMANEKEVHFFDHNYKRGIEWYRARFRDAQDVEAIGEATPRYMYDDEALVRISRDLPGVRLIAQLRHPVDRAYSHYWSRRARGRDDRDFEAAVSDELEGYPGAFPYLGRGRYVGYLNRVLELSDRADLLVLLFEDMRANPHRVFRRACSFLSILDDWYPPNLGAQINPYVEYRSRRVRRIRRHLPPALRSVAGRWNNKGGSYPAMDPAIRGALLEYFRDDNRLLSDWLGADLPGWEK